MGYDLTGTDKASLIALGLEGRHWTRLESDHQRRMGTLQLHGYVFGVWGVDGPFKLTNRGRIAERGARHELEIV